MQNYNYLTIGGIKTIRATRSELAQIMLADNKTAKSGVMALPRLVFSSNGTVIANYHRDKDFRNLLLEADIIDADGMPLVLASRLLCRQPLPERTATTDFIHDACRAAISQGMRFYFLGGSPGVADEAADKLRRSHEGIDIVRTRHGYFREEEEEDLCNEIVTSGADVLWVGLGSPKQEAFAYRNRHRLSGLTWIRTCGGLFDHVAGRFLRAPQWMQTFGLEWFFRAIQEPLRLGPRYIATNPAAFFYLLTKTHD